MTRLALFHPSFDLSGGAEFLIASQAQGLRSAGHEPHLVTMGYDAARWQHRLEGIPVSVFPKRHWLDLLTPWDRVGKIKRRAQGARPFLVPHDLVLAYNFPCSDMLGWLDLPGRKVWQCNEPPRGLHMRESNPVLAARVAASMGRFLEHATLSFARRLAVYDEGLTSKGPLHRRRVFDQESVARLDDLFAISAYSRANARAIYGRCAEQVVYPIVRFPEGGRTRRGLDRSGLKVLVHSRLEVLKNIDTVIRGFARFRERVDPRAELHVVGEGDHRGQLEALALEALGEQGWTFHGFLPDADLRAVYEACDVFALLPLDEPFGMVFPEAAAKGLLMVGPDHGGPLEILDGGALGWTCDPFDPEALASALAEVHGLSDAEAEQRREKADLACRARFSEQAVMPTLIAALEGRA